jgi:hypothetical protein
MDEHALNDEMRPAAPGLDADELRAERAGELPDRNAMSVIGVGGFEVGLPPPGFLDGVLDAEPPVGTLPVDGLPVAQLPVDPLPAVQPPVELLPIEPPIDGEPIGIPELPADTDASVTA